MKQPEYTIVNGKKFEINTSYKIAIKCNEIAKDNTIGDYERTLAIIYLLYGEKGLEDSNDLEELLEKAKIFLSCGEELEEVKGEPDMDYVEDMNYIEASFMYDYNIDLTKQDMHWWKFNQLMNGLSQSEFGNCCILNRVRNLRTMNLNDIKDDKQRESIRKAQYSVRLKKNKKVATKEQQENSREFWKLINLE